ncbi:MAG: reprolysin-like metallopeptidase [Paraglaciecola sp.]|uniref:reprolysin-like metallopeptidase n=1 Tax=Paraglaciecola sp. TaxID=1920173 RepID=UPI0032991D24
MSCQQCLLSLLGGVFCLVTQMAQGSGQTEVLPTHFKSLKPQSIQTQTISNNSLLTDNQHISGRRFTLHLKQVSIDILVEDLIETSGVLTQSAPIFGAKTKNTPAHTVLTSKGRGSFSTSFSASFKSAEKEWSLIYTQGESSGMGELVGNGQHLLIEQRGDQVFVVDLGLSGLTTGIYQDDIAGELPRFTAYHKNTIHTAATAANDEVVVVDVMLLFTQNIVDVYPDEMTQTLLNYLVFKANQTFYDSGINMQLRLVHSQYVDYPDPSSRVALNQLREALDGNPNTVTDPSLDNIASLRDTYGADVVSMIRTHDLNEREVCGIAMFPNPDLDYLVNVSNVGISGGSNCIDTFTHEIGHNFGAGHQQINGISQGVESAAGALVVPGKFNTIMSSIGTGDINRDFGLAVFSNPEVICAAVPCGDISVANNAATINHFSKTNAALRVAVAETELPALLPSLIDSDGDNVYDKDDVFPFDASEYLDTDLDGVGDNSDSFPEDFNEQFDTDIDGIGNNADTDDDNDGIVDDLDALPLDHTETVDADADGIGANSDQLDNHFQESQDNDLDGIGDRSDLDDDNDGVADYYPATQISDTEAWVVSAGSDSILRFNSQTGAFIGSLLEVAAGGFSFRSDAVLSQSQQLFFIAFSDVLAFDRQTDSVRTVIDRQELSSNFPVHLAFETNEKLLVNNGLGGSSIQRFDLTASGNIQADSVSDADVWRDFVVTSDKRLIVAQRSTNSLLVFNLANLTASPQIFSDQGLNKPEHLALDSADNIYVTNAGSEDLSKFDNNGNFVGQFVSAGSGGLGKSSCLTMGPDENIYICSGDTNEVLKYDGQTGNFLGVFIQAGAGGLDHPVSLVFAGLPQDEFRVQGEHDSDGDLVNNLDDAFPLDSTESVDTDNDGTGNNADTDDDNDNLPDSYEMANHFNSLDSSDAQQDADNDGSSNLVEFEAGTDPNDANDTPTGPDTPNNSDGSGGGSLAGWWLFLTLTLVIFRPRETSKLTLIDLRSRHW